MKKVFFKSSVLAGILLSSTAAFAAQEGELSIWINGDKGYNGLAEVGKLFEKETGIKVSVSHPANLESRFPQVASTGDGPDIVFWAHDRFGGYAEAGLLQEIVVSSDFESKFSDFTWDAVSYKGKKVGYPVAVEALSLIYNKDIISEAPSTWEEILVLDKELKKEGKGAIAWNLAEPFFSWPLLASDGGYAFKSTPDGYDSSDVGVNNEGAVRAMTFLKKLVDSDVIGSDTDYSVAESEFAQGKVAMTINGPWSWANIDTANIDYGVTTLPTFNGNSSKPFVGVLTAGISSASPNGDLAREFIESYLLTDDGLRMVNDDVPLGAVALKSFQEEIAEDSRIDATMANALNGEVMPNIPEMTAFWVSEKSAILNVATDRQGIEDALDSVASRMKGK
ncbi:maltose ABC transporter periplasmic binding protein [Vibrio chagasii]|nr:maltose ABC transporter periplasmic binding protein [Vibrio chagasii]